MRALDDKAESVKQWDADPCGSSGAAGLEVGSREFFEQVDRDRYERYAPWMRGVMEFDTFSGKRVLEVGFGMGTDLFQFARNGAIVSGIDLVPKHLEIASSRFRVYGIRADLRLGDAEDLPYADNSFDSVYTMGVIHHTPDTKKAVDEIYRVLKPGGRATIAVYHKHSAFLTLDTVASMYLLHGGFLRDSWRRTLSRIEYRERSDACPLVKVFTRGQMRRMLTAFTSVRITVHHISHSDFGTFRRLVPRSVVPRLEPLFGWYIVAKCTK